jgi:nucleotide-binding universal stress UspA family protein
MYEQIVVALDGSPLAEQILPHVEALAEKFDSTLTLVRAMLSVPQIAALIEPSAEGIPLDPSLIDETIDSERDEATEYLSHVASVLRQHDLKVEIEAAEGPAADVIAESAARLKADLIGMTTHGRSGLSNLVFGSVAEGVLHKATCPVLLVRVRESS